MEGWTNKPLGVIAQIVMGQSPDSKYYSEQEVGLPFLQGCAEFTERFPIANIYCSQSKKTARSGVILFSVRAPVGKTNLADRDYIIGRGLAALSACEISQDYLNHYITYSENDFHNASQGSTFEAINSKELNNWAIEFPELPEEQTQIAAVLSTVDRAIAQTEAIIAKQQRIKTGLMQDLLTKGIDKNGNIRSEETHEFKDSAIGRIPVEWEISPVQDVAAKSPNSTAIGPFGSNLIASDYRDQGVPIIFVRDIKDGIFHWISNVFVSLEKARSLKAHRVNPDDVIATKMGLPPCIAAVYPKDAPSGVMTADIIKLTPDSQIADPKWVAIFLNTEKVRSQVRQITGGVTRPKITLRDFRGLLILLPQKNEQERIINFLQSFEQQIENNTLDLHKTKKEKTGLMQDLLTGKVRVTELLKNTELVSL
jgi:type I restriction enzyme, S subunit